MQDLSRARHWIVPNFRFDINLRRKFSMLFQFKIQLKDIHGPTVWRRVTVPGIFSFYKFHRVIQAAFGWADYHLFQFSPRGYGSSPVISLPDPDDDMSDFETLNAKKIKLQDIFYGRKTKIPVHL